MNKQTSREILKSIGNKVKMYRVYSGLSQKDLENISSVSIRTLSRLEQGSSIQLDSFIKIICALDLEKNIDILIPDQVNRPSMYLDENKKIKQRVHKKNNISTTFSWGED